MKFEAHVRRAIKVPAAEFHAALTELGRLGKVQSQSISTADVAGQTVDLQARLAAQRAAIDRLEGLVKRANGVSDVLAVERELDTRLADLESLQAQLDALDHRTQYATIAAHFAGHVVAAQPKAKHLPGFVAGLRTGWHSFTGFIPGVSAVIGFALPSSPLLLIGALVIIVARRRGRARHAIVAGTSVD